MKREIPFIIINWRRPIISINEGYGPINFCLCLRPFFYYLFFYGKRYYPKYK